MTYKLVDILGRVDRNASQMSDELAEKIGQNFDNFLNEIDLMISKDPDKAFGMLLSMIIVANEAFSKKPIILEWLWEKIKKLKEKANAIAKEMGAEKFTIGVGAPARLSVQMIFPV
jgi:hypothetical protein